MSSKENITREGIVASTPQYCNDIAEYGNSEIQTDARKIQNIQKYVRYIYMIKENCKYTPILQQQLKNIAIFERH